MGGAAQVDSLLLAVITVEAEHACLRECASECVTVSVSQQEATDDHDLLDENTATSAFHSITRARGTMSDESAEPAEAPEVKTFTELGLDDRLLKVRSGLRHHHYSHIIFENTTCKQTTTNHINSLTDDVSLTCQQAVHRLKWTQPTLIQVS